MEQPLPGVTAVYIEDVRSAEPERDLAPLQTALQYTRTRIGGRNGLTFFRCLRCRALIEELLIEQQAHDRYHADLDGALGLTDPNETDGWGTPRPEAAPAGTGDGTEPAATVDSTGSPTI